MGRLNWKTKHKRLKRERKENERREIIGWLEGKRTRYRESLEENYVWGEKDKYHH